MKETSTQTWAETRVIRIDMPNRLVVEVCGYAGSAPILDGAVLEADLTVVRGGRSFFVRGVFPGMDLEGFEAWLAKYDGAPGAWASRVEGDFAVVIWDPAASVVMVVADRVGAHRTYVHSAGGKVTITNRLLDQVRRQDHPRLGDPGVYSLLTLKYPLDPYCELDETWVVTLGEFARCNGSGVTLEHYYNPVDLRPSLYRDVDECCTTIGGALAGFLERRTRNSATPLLMLSGGIDSVGLLSYLCEVAPGRTEALTFSVEGQANSEAPEARIAAQHFGVRHHVLTIRAGEIDRLLRESLVATDRSSYGGFGDVALAEALRADGRRLDVFRGEDTRLHTPSIDLPGLLGLVAVSTGLQRSSLGAAAYSALRLLEHWPVRKGRNYFRYFASKSALRPDVRRYALEALARYAVPAECAQSMPPFLESATAGLQRLGDLDRFYRELVRFEYRVQYTEDMHGASVAHETGTSHAVFPFYQPDVVAACNRVPLAMGLRPILVSPRLTRSPFPVAEKYVLRKLLRGRAPDALLYRRKATAPAFEAVLRASWRRTMLPILEAWSPGLLQQLHSPTREIAEHHVRMIRSGPEYAQRDMGLTSALTRLCVLAYAISNPRAILLDAIGALPMQQGS